MEKEIIRQSGIDCSLRRFVSMKILIAPTNAPRHLNPLLAVANILRKHNHEVVVQPSTVVRAMVEDAGLPFILSLPGADQYIAEFPERQIISLGSR